MTDFKGKQFAGRIRNADGTFGISSTMSMDDMLKNLIDFLPMDVIYTINSTEDGIIDLQPIGRIGLCFKAGDSKQEQFHEEEKRFRQEANQNGNGESNRGGESGVDARREHRPVSSKLSRKRQESAAEQASTVESVGEDEGRDLEEDQVPLDLPTPEKVAAVKADQRKNVADLSTLQARLHLIIRTGKGLEKSLLINLIALVPRISERVLVHVNSLPNVVYARQVSVLQEIKKNHGYDAWVETLRYLLRSDLWFLLRYAMKQNFMDEKLQGQVMMSHYAKSIYKNDGVGCDLLTLVPRNHCKTTFGAGFLIQEILNNVDIAIAIVSGTEKLAKNIAKLIADTLTDNEILQEAFPDVLPTPQNPANNWGIRGYFLPTRTNPRADPTLVVGSVAGNVTGTHPDILLFDDIVYSVKEADLNAAETCFIEAMGLLGSSGKVIINGTRWSDKDLYGKILDGRYTGNLGPYESLVLSCWADVNKTKPIYDKKIRPGSEKTSGFSREDLYRKRINNAQFFNCQYLNDPAPEEDQPMKVSDIQIYEADTIPYTKALVIGAEIVGTSITFPALFRKVAEDYNLNIYLQEIRPKRAEYSSGKDKNKLERIFFTLAPIIQEKLLYAQQWMIDGKSDLGYEVRKFGSAKNDDIVDALHMIPAYMSSGIRPPADRPAQAYIVADLAFRETEDADFSVFMALAIDHKNRHYILDYKRYKQQNPISLAQDLIKFFQQINSKAIDVSYNGKRGSKFARSYS